MFYPSEHIVLISIGTGDIGKVCDATIQAYEAHKQILEAQKNDKKLLYFRFHPKLEQDVDVTDQSTKKIEELLDTTNNYIENHQENFQELLKLMAFKTNNHTAS